MIATLVPLVEYIAPAPVVIVKLFGDIVLGFAVSSDCKRHGLLLEGLDSVVWLFGGRGAFESWCRLVDGIVVAVAVCDCLVWALILGSCSVGKLLGGRGAFLLGVALLVASWVVPSVSVCGVGFR